MLCGCMKEETLKDVPPEKIWEDANKFMNNKNYKKAAKYYEDFEIFYPAHKNSQEALFQRGLAHYKNRNYAQAAAVLENFADIYPNTQQSEKAKRIVFFCFYNQITRHDRDQNIREKAIEAGENYAALGKDDKDFEMAFKHAKIMQLFNLLKRVHIALKFFPKKWTQALWASNLVLEKDHAHPIAAECYYRWIEFLTAQNNAKATKDAHMILQKMEEHHKSSEWFQLAQNKFR